MQPRSNGTKWSAPHPAIGAACMALVSAPLSRRAMAMTSWPAARSVVAIPSPSPRLPPVTMTLGIATPEFAGRRDLECVDDADRRRNLERGQRAPTRGEDLGLGALDRRTVERPLSIQCENDVGGDNRAGDRVLARRNQRHADTWMPIDHGFDLFRMNLQATDIDDAAPPAHEIPAATALL